MFEKILLSVGKVFGTSEIGKEVVQLFKGNKQKQREFEIMLAEQLSQNFKEELKDLKNARLLQVEALKQSDNFSKRFLYYLTAFLIFSTVAISVFPFFFEFPVNNENMIQRATDFLYTVTGARVISFFFGDKFKK